MFMETQPVLPLTASYSRGADFPPLSQLCIGQVLDQMAADFPESPALILSQEKLRFTWRELHAGKLYRHGGTASHWLEREEAGTAVLRPERAGYFDDARRGVRAGGSAGEALGAGA